MDSALSFFLCQVKNEDILVVEPATIPAIVPLLMLPFAAAALPLNPSGLVVGSAGASVFKG